MENQGITEALERPLRLVKAFWGAVAMLTAAIVGSVGLWARLSGMERILLVVSVIVFVLGAAWQFYSMQRRISALEKELVQLRKDVVLVLSALRVRVEKDTEVHYGRAGEFVDDSEVLAAVRRLSG